jgi:hypothetical protein
MARDPALSLNKFQGTVQSGSFYGDMRAVLNVMPSEKRSVLTAAALAPPGIIQGIHLSCS